jgi:Ca-activated chloride channel family protein
MLSGNSRLIWMILLALVVTGSVQAQQDNPLETIKIDTNLVVLRVAVNDQQGRAAMSLKQDAFKIYEDGVEQQIGFFSAEESPVSWALVLDRSGSMMDMMTDVYDAALHVIDEGTSRDETFIVTFNKKPDMVIDFTSDRHRLENSILGLRADGETALYDAVNFALDGLKQAKNRKRVLIVVTDGQDNASRLKFRELIERAEEEEAVIYTVGMFGEMGDSSGFLARFMGGDRDGRAELKKLAEVTGGLAHFPKNVDQCKSVMREIAREVSQQYSLGYYPANKERDGKWRAIKVAVSQNGNSAKLIARTRSGYYARKAEQESKSDE